VVSTTIIKKKLCNLYIIFKKNRFYFILFSLLLFFFVLLFNILYIFYDDNFVNNEFKKTNIENYIINASIIDKEIRDYLTFKKNTISNKDLEENEILHLYDVKILFLIGFILLMVIFIVICLIFYKTYKNIIFFIKKFKLFNCNKKILILNFLIIISTITLFFSIITGIVALIIQTNFDFFFIIFHKIFFFNDLWLMNYDDLLIQLYPETFFLNAFKLIFLKTIIFFIFLWLIILILNIKHFNFKKHKI
jgi:uncharacterized membrane protein